MVVDYSLYLVTDSTQAILGQRNLFDVVRAALEGGVTIVQYRDKKSETGQLIKNARNLVSLCGEYGVPLIVNDRVDVALAVNAQGVHLGQEDMDAGEARKILGAGAIIGVTCSSVTEAKIAIEKGANYLGIGTIYHTPTKYDTKAIIGPMGVRQILDGLSELNRKVATVAIGGLNAYNIQRVLFKASGKKLSLNGVAVVSAIMAASNVEEAARHLRTLVSNRPKFITGLPGGITAVEELLQQVPLVITSVSKKAPLCHNMTNLVVQNFAANVALAIGASPIMANNGDEALELASHGGSLVINMGSMSSDALKNYIQAVQAYNEHGGPVLFDPVGAGATMVRREAVTALLASGYVDVIKGNESEIKSLLGVETQQRGVDSSLSTSSDLEKATTARRLALRERNVVMLTGKTDFLTDGFRCYAIENGHKYLGHITGSGCILGTTIAACLAAHTEDKLLATLAAALMFEIASERAAARADVRGPGTFVPAFIDELFDISQSTVESETGWLEAAKVHAIEFDSRERD